MSGRAATWVRARGLRTCSLVAVLAWTAHAHWALATLLGAPVWLAWGLPVAIDAYVLAALRTWERSPGRRVRDLGWALGLDCAAVAASHAAGQVVMPTGWRASAAAGLGVVLVLVLWRVHALDVRTGQRGPLARAHALGGEGTSARTPRTVSARTPRTGDEMAARRALRARWDDGGRTLSAAQVAEDLGISRSAARALLSRWRRDVVATEA
jgi:hypothetical protein